MGFKLLNENYKFENGKFYRKKCGEGDSSKDKVNESSVTSCKTPPQNICKNCNHGRHLHQIGMDYECHCLFEYSDHTYCVCNKFEPKEEK